MCPLFKLEELLIRLRMCFTHTEEVFSRALSALHFVYRHSATLHECLAHFSVLIVRHSSSLWGFLTFLYKFMNIYAL